MIRWLRLAVVGALVVFLVAIGVGMGLFFVANDVWVEVDVPERLQKTWLFGSAQWELSVPGLIAGWLLAVFVTCGLLLWSVYYVYRKRQYDALVGSLERELAELRNLPFTAPAPLEDLPEEPSAEAAEVLAFRDERAFVGGDSR